MSLDFVDLFSRYNTRMFQQALHLAGGNVHDAHDIVGIAWERAWRSRDEYADVAKPLGWLISITRYAALSYTNEYRNPTVSISGVDFPMVDNTSAWPGLEDPQTQRVIGEVLPILTEIQFATTWLHCIGGFTNIETAELLHVTPGNVRSHVQAALGKLSAWCTGDYQFTSRRLCKGCGMPTTTIGHRTRCQDSTGGKDR